MLSRHQVIRIVGFSGALLLAATVAACGGHPLNTQLDCGNGVVDGTEECDGAELGGVACEDLGFAGGTLACTTQCTFDTSECSNTGSCGDGTLDPGEECDGAELDSETCASLGWDSGALACDTSCHYDVTACEGTGPVCGNDAQELGEQCDGSDLDGATCADLGWDGGTLGCTTACAYDETGCADIEPMCGDDVVNHGMEECDGNDLDGATCASLGYDGGTLGCTANCTFDETGCGDIQPMCGDGVINTMMEECDGADLGGATCETLGWDGGTLACTGNCHLDTSGCFYVQPICGDGVANPPAEECDGNDLNGETCQSLGFGGGMLSCNANCHFDTSTCWGGGPTCSPTGGTLSCNMATTGTNLGAPDLVDNWSNCASWPLNGPEMVYAFVQTGGTFYQNITVDVSGLSADLDLMVLSSNGGGCDPALGCPDISGNPNNDPEQVSFQYSPGDTFFIVVDGYDNATSDYTISVSCN